MTTNTTDRPLIWAGVALIATLLVVPAFGMNSGMMGTGPMMDGMWGASGAGGWMLVVGIGMQLLVAAVVVGTIYFAYRTMTAEETSSDPAVAELRAAYARGDMSEEEYERRRAKLDSER